MIAANVEAARFLKKHRMPTLYRVHGQPEDDRLETLRQFLRGFGIQLPTDRDLTPQDLSAVLQQVVGSEEAHLIETVVVRSMPQAVYQPENIGHFGLALPEYAHFTSPIRRYPGSDGPSRHPPHPARRRRPRRSRGRAAAMAALGQQCSFNGAARRRSDARCAVVAEVRVHAATSSARSSMRWSRASSTSACSCR